MERIGWLFVFFLIGSLGFLALLILGLWMWREERAAKRAKEAGQDGAPEGKAAEAKAPALKLPQMGSLFSARPNAPEAHEVLRVLRDHLTGRLVVEIGGRRYAHTAEVTEPRILQGFLTTLQDLENFAAHAPAPAAPPVPPALAPNAPIVPPAAPSAADPAPPPPQPASISNPPISASPARADEPLQMPSMNVFKQVRVLREMSKQPPPPLKTIAEQIDEVLQGRIAGTPHRQRGLRVSAGPQGNALFELDGRAYEAVDDLPDAEARSLVRAAIGEWEKRQ
jgi:hypothetical protein